ncbi:hypothetical protein HaLaN_01205, partial [Haematococcus lacustris]
MEAAPVQQQAGAAQEAAEEASGPLQVHVLQAQGIPAA